MTTFSREVDTALQAARNGSEFVLSRAEEEAALAPLVGKLLAMKRDAAVAYIKASWRGAGTYDVLAVAMFKSATLSA